MRKLITMAFMSLDGVIQAPGGPEEDRTGGFRFGGWIVPLMDEVAGEAIGEAFEHPFELVLGRKTYEIFAAYWPFYDEAGEDGFVARTFNATTKYVASRSQPELGWANSEWLGTDTVARLRELKQGDGPDLITQGSADLIQSLLAADLIDAFRLLIFPVMLGQGKRLFGEGATPGGLRLTRSTTSPGGVIVACYDRAGEVVTGSFVDDNPTEAELARRKRWWGG